MSVQERYDANSAAGGPITDSDGDNLNSQQRSDAAERFRQLASAPVDGMPQPQRGVLRKRLKKRSTAPIGNSAPYEFKIHWLPAAGLVMCGLFAAGFLGGRLAAVQWGSDTPAQKIAAAKILSEEPAAPTTSNSVVVEKTTAALAAVPTATITPVATRTIVPEAQPLTPSVSAGVGQPVAEPDAQPAAAKPIVNAALSDLKPAGASIETLLEEGHRLEKTGDLSAARLKFHEAFEKGSSAAALALGRSFDPRYVHKLTGLKEGADPGLAKRWYEQWYLRGVQNGEVSSKVRYDRLIKSLQRG